MVWVIAHRGASGLTPENTLTAFRKAVELSVDMVEFDVQPTSDHKLVIMHDKTIDRTTNEIGKAPDLTFDYLRSLDAGSWFDEKFTGELIPTFKQAIESVPEPILLNIELKYYSPDDEWFVKAVYEEIKFQRVIERSVISARHVENLQQIKDLDPSVRCCLLQKERTEEEYLEIMIEMGLDIAQLRRRSMNPEYIEKLHSHNIHANIFYADTEEDMREYIDMGIDGILTNFPDRLMKVVSEI